MKRIICFILVLTVMGTLVACSGYSYLSEYLEWSDIPKDMEEFDWPKSDIAKLLPVPASNYGKILWEAYYGFVIYVGNTTKEEYDDYVDAVFDLGFTVNYQKGNDYFYADNAAGYSVSLNYKGSDTMFIRIDEPQDGFGDTVRPSGGGDSLDYIPDYIDAVSFEKALNNGEKVEGKIVKFEVSAYKPDSILGINCWAGEHLNFISAENLDVKAGDWVIGYVAEEPACLQGSWIIHYEPLTIINDAKGPGNSTPPTAPTQSTTLPATNPQSSLPDNKLLMDSDSTAYIGMNPQNVESSLRMLGFSNIKKVANVTTDTTKTDGMVASVQINGNEFNKGDAFEKDIKITITYWRIVEPVPKIIMPSDSSTYIGKSYQDVEKIFRDLGFKNVSLVTRVTTDSKQKDGTVVSVNADMQAFSEGDAFEKDTVIVITYWKYTEPQPQIVLPLTGTKLAKDFDVKSEYTVYYVNVDNLRNKPVLQKWGNATITDGVAEYLEYLKDLGFAVTITNTSHKEPYAGFHLYETEFKVSKGSFYWTMYLGVQDEDYTEYEFRINLQ